jgi:signal transduction histidine kinase
MAWIMKLSNRIFISIFWIIVVSGLASAVTGAVLISRAVRAEAFSRVSSDLRVARLYISRLIDDLAVSSLAVAGGFEGKMGPLQQPDFSILLGGDEDPLASYLRDVAGLDLSRPQRGFLPLPLDLVVGLGMVRDHIAPSSYCEGRTTLWLFATERGGLGTAFSGILLNDNEPLVSDLQELLFGRDLYERKPFGTVTVFCGDRRIATTVVGPSGDIALGTRVSDVVREKVLLKGGVWLDRAYVVDDWYLSAYEPIRDIGGRTIGILYVGVLEKKYLDIRNRALALLSGVTLPVLFLFVFVVFLVSKTIVKPVSALAEASRAIASGEADPSIAVRTRSSELQSLTGSFRKMAEAVEKREDLLRRANIELADTNRDYQELLSFVTHELNNSVGSLLLNVSILNDPSMGRMDEEQREVAAQVLRDVERFRDMVRNYLNISRLEKGTLRFNPASIDVREGVIEPVLRRLMSRIQHRGMEVRWSWECRGKVTADPELLDICYSNLIVNAIKYGDEYIELTCRRDERGIVLGVINGGKPIPPDKIDLLFQKFSRLVKSDDGAGLGLYLVRHILDRHGGKVWCESPADTHTGTSTDVSVCGGTGFFMLLA